MTATAASLLKSSSPVQTGGNNQKQGYGGRNQEKAAAFLNLSVPSKVEGHNLRIGAIPLYASKERDAALIAKLTDSNGVPDPQVMQNLVESLIVDLHIIDEETAEFGF